MNHAILLSGGTGSRMGGELPKQYCRIVGRTMISFSLDVLLKGERVDAVWIAAAQAYRKSILEEAKQLGMNTAKLRSFSEPGRNRQESILNCLQCIKGNKDYPEMNDRDTVLIHDAARPLLTGRLLEECYAALGDHDGVLPVLRITDTLYYAQDKRDPQKAEGVLDRETVFAGQAPELFRFKPYLIANLILTEGELLRINGSTEVALLAGLDIVMIPGDESNFKVTTPKDMERFRGLVENRERHTKK